MVFLWLVATGGVVYVANAAVELVDLQVFPGGSRIEVLSLPEPTEPSAPTTTEPAAPTTTAQMVLPLVVITGSLPEPRVGENYQAELEASGGTPPYSWRLVGGSLPDGLTLSSDGLLRGVVGATADVVLVFGVSDAQDHASNSPSLRFITAPDRRTVIARGGTIFVDTDGDSVFLFLVSPADGYSAVIVEPGGFRVEVQFLPLQGDATSWVVCEVDDGLVCTSG